MEDRSIQFLHDQSATTAISRPRIVHCDHQTCGGCSRYRRFPDAGPLRGSLAIPARRKASASAPPEAGSFRGGGAAARPLASPRPAASLPVPGGVVEPMPPPCFPSNPRVDVSLPGRLVRRQDAVANPRSLLFDVVECGAAVTDRAVGDNSGLPAPRGPCAAPFAGRAVTTSRSPRDNQPWPSTSTP